MLRNIWRMGPSVAPVMLRTDRCAVRAFAMAMIQPGAPQPCSTWSSQSRLMCSKAFSWSAKVHAGMLLMAVWAASEQMARMGAAVPSMTSAHSTGSMSPGSGVVGARRSKCK